MSLVKDGLAKAWAQHLTEKVGFPFFPHRYDGESAPPFGVVVVKRLSPTVMGDDVHRAEVRVVVVSDFSEGAPVEQQKMAGAAYKGLLETPQHAVDESNGVRLCGFMVDDMEQAEGSGEDGRKVYSDVFMVTAGVGSA